MAKRSTRKPAIAVLFTSGLFVAACGGAAPEAKSPAQAAPVSNTDQPPSGAGASGAQPSAMPDSAPSVPVSTESNDPTGWSRDAELRGARRDLQLATRELDSSLGDCANVCRALSSLERATAHLCALASGDSDHNACDDAKTRVTHARAQIKASCGTCPSGT